MLNYFESLIAGQGGESNLSYLGSLFYDCSSYLGFRMCTAGAPAPCGGWEGATVEAIVICFGVRQWYGLRLSSNCDVRGVASELQL